MNEKVINQDVVSNLVVNSSAGRVFVKKNLVKQGSTLEISVIREVLKDYNLSSFEIESEVEIQIADRNKILKRNKLILHKGCFVLSDIELKILETNNTDRLEVKGCKLQRLSCSGQTFEVHDCEIRDFTIENSNKNSQFIGIKGLAFLRVNSSAKGLIQNVLPTDRVSFKSSPHSKQLTLKNVNFSQTKEHLIENPNYFLSVIKERLIWRTKEISDQNDDLYELKRIYHSLKSEAIKDYDSIQALEFQEQEMKVQKNILAKEGKGFWSSEGFIFWCNETFSDHGTNWLKPLAWYFLIGPVLYFVYNFLGGVKINHLAWPTLEGLMALLNEVKNFYSLNWSEFWLFLLPVNFLKADLATLNSWEIVIKSTWWIFSLYLIYNMLLGFRKYSRKL